MNSVGNGALEGLGINKRLKTDKLALSLFSLFFKEKYLQLNS